MNNGMLAPEQRQLIREALDKLARQRAAGGFCASCGAPCDERTPGCKSCKNRHYGRRKRLRRAGA